MSNWHSDQIQEHMALLAEGGRGSFPVYKHDPPAEGSEPDFSLSPLVGLRRVSRFLALIQHLRETNYRPVFAAVSCNSIPARHHRRCGPD